MRYIIFLVLMKMALFGAYIESKIVTVDGDEATISLPEVDIGVSGFVVRILAPDHSMIVSSATVISFEKESQKATLKLEPYTLFRNNNLPTLKLKPKAGDKVILAYGYDRGLLIAPNEEIYYTLTRAMKNETFVHPDVFATLLSYHGHPTPLKEDFSGFCSNVTVGLLFFYLEKKLYTVDCHSFRILNVQDAPLEQHSKKLPFYSRIEKIEANWFGEGSDELEDYEPYYYELLYEYNPKNETLIQSIKNSNEANVTKLADELDLGENK